jgi:hypothetical protein
MKVTVVQSEQKLLIFLKVFFSLEIISIFSFFNNSSKVRKTVNLNKEI